MIRPPQSEDELLGRARLLVGRDIEELALALAVPEPPWGVRGKGKVGELVEKVLGATAGSAKGPDFPELGIELKTVPVDAERRPLESTFVCAISLMGADRADWEGSLARAKLARVLFVPVIRHDGRRRIIDEPVFFRPSDEQESILRADFEEAMGRIGCGGVEAVTARMGRWLQVRPKAKNGRVRALSFGPEGEWIETVPRGFYLRALFTAAILRDPSAAP